MSRRTELETVSECQRHKEQAFLCLAVCLAPRGMLQRTNGEIPNRPRRPFPGPGGYSRPPQPEITRGGSGSCLLKSGWEEGAQVFSGGGRTRVGTVRRALVTQGSEGVEAVHWGNPTGEQQNKWEWRAAGTPDPPAPLLTPTVCRYIPATPHPTGHGHTGLLLTSVLLPMRSSAWKAVPVPSLPWANAETWRKLFSRVFSSRKPSGKRRHPSRRKSQRERSLRSAESDHVFDGDRKTSLAPSASWPYHAQHLPDLPGHPASCQASVSTP